MSIEITEQMLQAALHKAIEAGLFPRRCTREELGIYKQIISEIVKAALEAELRGRQKGFGW